MKKSTLSVLALVTLALTACGGSSNDAPIASSPTVVVPSPTTNTPANTATTTANATITGQAIELDDRRVRTSALASNNINQLVVGGRTYDVGYAGISSGGFTNIKTRAYHNISSGTHLSYAKYGFYEDEATDREYLYYQGQMTPISAMPASGVATYVGGAVHDCDDCHHDDPVTGTSRFEVNFGAKTLTGHVTSGHINIPLSANITGNTFAGTTANGTTTNGAFFGANAEELAGTYVNTAQEFAGSFGAKK